MHFSWNKFAHHDTALFYHHLTQEESLSNLSQLSKLKLKLHLNQLNSSNPLTHPLPEFQFIKLQTSPSISNQSSSTTSKYLDKMGVITVVNNTASDIYVSVTYDGSDFQKGGSEAWTRIGGNGGKDTWRYRENNQIARVVRSQNAGTPVESYLAVQDQTVYII